MGLTNRLHDHMGRRVEKAKYVRSGDYWLPEKATLFVYEGYKLIEELDGLAAGKPVLRRYTWQPESVGPDVPLTVYDVETSQTYFYHTDANKNVTELTDIEGNVVAHYEYSPFDQVTKAAGDFAETNAFRFSSEYHDDETGLVYYNYRFYDPQLGRWLSRDPIEELGGVNLYAFVVNNGVCLQDDKGLIWGLVGQIIGITGGVILAIGAGSGNIPLAIVGGVVMGIGAALDFYSRSQTESPQAKAEKLEKQMPTPDKNDKENSPTGTSTDRIDKIFDADKDKDVPKTPGAGRCH